MYLFLEKKQKFVSVDRNNKIVQSDSPAIWTIDLHDKKYKLSTTIGNDKKYMDIWDKQSPDWVVYKQSKTNSLNQLFDLFPVSDDPRVVYFGCPVIKQFVGSSKSTIFTFVPNMTDADIFTLIAIPNDQPIKKFNTTDTATLQQQKVHLRICTFNLGYNVMCNDVKNNATEKRLVQKCQDKYKTYDVTSIGSVSICSQNAAQFLSQYSLFGLQEISNKHSEAFFKKIKSNANNQQYNFTKTSNGDWTVVTGFDEMITGPGIQITSPNDHLIVGTDSRGIQATYFGKIKLIFINLHAPHKISFNDIQSKIIEIEFNNQHLKYNVERIVIVGDFNDFNGKFADRSFKMFDKEISLPKNVSLPKSCCEDSQYQYVGDYIFDSEKIHSYFGFPLKYKRQDPLMSDHDPVVLIDYDKKVGGRKSVRKQTTRKRVTKRKTLISKRKSSKNTKRKPTKRRTSRN